MELSTGIEMPRYKSHKTVWGLKIKAIDSTPNPGAVMLTFENEQYAPKEVSIIDRPVPEPGWYYVVYKDGYHSFSPAKQFEEGNSPERSNEAAGIGWAVKQMQNGEKVRRAGWNGKGMFLVLCPSSVFVVNRKPYNEVFPEGAEVSYQAHVDMYTANGTVVPWLASQTDLLAIDWELAQ